MQPCAAHSLDQLPKLSVVCWKQQKITRKDGEGVTHIFRFSCLNLNHLMTKTAINMSPTRNASDSVCRARCNSSLISNIIQCQAPVQRSRSQQRIQAVRTSDSLPLQDASAVTQIVIKFVARSWVYSMVRWSTPYGAQLNLRLSCLSGWHWVEQEIL